MLEDLPFDPCLALTVARVSSRPFETAPGPPGNGVENSRSIVVEPRAANVHRVCKVHRGRPCNDARHVGNRPNVPILQPSLDPTGPRSSRNDRPPSAVKARHCLTIGALRGPRTAAGN